MNSSQLCNPDAYPLGTPVSGLLETVWLSEAFAQPDAAEDPIDTAQTDSPRARDPVERRSPSRTNGVRGRVEYAIVRVHFNIASDRSRDCLISRF